MRNGNNALAHASKIKLKCIRVGKYIYIKNNDGIPAVHI